MKLSIRLFIILFFISNSTLSTAQCWNLVWEDEFIGSSLDLTSWEYQTGGGGWGNNELQYYTNGDNVSVSNGTLKITADEDSGNQYPSNDFTSSRIRTRYKGDWRYGKMEASIKLPEGQGIWPAFWMMPTDNVYGTWPSSGEIDIMEYLGHQTSTLYGTCHYGNSPSDKGSTGASTTLSSGIFPDNFHTFSIEWEPTQIRWYLDGTQYLTVNDSDPDFMTYNWPFDQDFHFILNLAVGGDWPGAPNGSTVFPQTMEVDWVRVYQELPDLKIEGTLLVEPNATNTIYSLPNISGATYTWSVPANATINSGQNTNQISVDWGNNSGAISADITTTCGTESYVLNIEVSPNLWINYDFEDGFDNWSTKEHNGASANFEIVTTNVQQGSQSACVTTQTLTANSWDIQLSRSQLNLVSGEDYTVSFWAKADQLGKDVNIAFINSNNFSWYGGTGFNVTDSWAFYSYSFTASETAIATFNLDLGDELGTFCFDDFLFARTVLLPVEYADFWLTPLTNNTIEIHWTTEIEDQLDYFEVQKSYDLKSWETIKKMTAKGKANHYETLDLQPKIGDNYYRIKSIDFDGSENLTPIISTKIKSPLFYIYPNPTKNVLNVECKNLKTIQVFSFDGKLISEIQIPDFSNLYQLDLNELENGTYFIKALGKNFVEIEQFIKLN